jgi:hypothetical protein
VTREDAPPQRIQLRWSGADALFTIEPVRTARLRLRAEQLGIESVESEGRTLAVKISAKPAIDGDKLVSLIAEREDCKFTSAGVLKLKLPGAGRLMGLQLRATWTCRTN